MQLGGLTCTAALLYRACMSGSTGRFGLLLTSDPGTARDSPSPSSSDTSATGPTPCFAPVSAQRCMLHRHPGMVVLPRPSCNA